MPGWAMVKNELGFINRNNWLLVTIGGATIYHSGDTGLFYDMKLIGEMNRIDLAFLPIGDNFTMGVDDAVKAVELSRRIPTATLISASVAFLIITLSCFLGIHVANET